MKRQFTATVYILHLQQVLLIFHRKFQKWLPPGGHLNPNETPAEGALREVMEETGLEVELIPQENIWINRWNANSLPRPWMCLLENIAASPKEEEHQHIDFIYLARPARGRLQSNEKELESIRWFNREEVLALKGDEEIFVETQQTLDKLLAEAP